MQRVSLLVFLLLSSFCCVQASDDFQPSSTNVWGAEYPRLDSSGRVQVRVKAPSATKVKWNFWSGPEVDMEKQADWWMVQVQPTTHVEFKSWDIHQEANQRFFVSGVGRFQQGRT